MFCNRRNNKLTVNAPPKPRQLKLHSYFAGFAVHLNFLAFYANVLTCTHFKQPGQELQPIIHHLLNLFGLRGMLFRCSIKESK